ncbi:PliI family lysozyme inhibitor of I-type lysozyme [Shewanella colwelliana]|uniref:PliI family lysozyme inhibitor of I-type lysozyme n=1 Tax=Shewanella colwelliana TaxID=23 RepID=UPI003D06FC85
MMKCFGVALLAVSLCGCSVNINKPAKQKSSSEVVQADTGYSQALTLANGYSLVVSEGALEPRSIGSVTVALYRDLSVGDFVSAVSFMRDGSVLKSSLVENGSDRQKITVTMATAGSGNYQNSQSVCAVNQALSLC